MLIGSDLGLRTHGDCGLCAAARARVCARPRETLLPRPRTCIVLSALGRVGTLLTILLVVARRHGCELDVLREGLHLGGLVLGRHVLDVAPLAPLQLLRGDERDDDEEAADAVLPRERVREENEGDDEGEHLVRVSSRG